MDFYDEWDICTVQRENTAFDTPRYSVEPPNINLEEAVDTDDLQPGISPVMFRTLVGRGHAEFSTKKQQDAMEFLEHILKMTSCNSAGVTDPGNCFKFEVGFNFF